MLALLNCESCKRRNGFLLHRIRKRRLEKPVSIDLAYLLEHAGSVLPYPMFLHLALYSLAQTADASMFYQTQDPFYHANHDHCL